MTSTVRLHCGKCGSEGEFPLPADGPAVERGRCARDIYADWAERHAPCLESAGEPDFINCPDIPPSSIYPAMGTAGPTNAAVAVGRAIDETALIPRSEFLALLRALCAHAPDMVRWQRSVSDFAGCLLAWMEGNAYAPGSHSGTGKGKSEPAAQPCPACFALDKDRPSIFPHNLDCPNYARLGAHGRNRGGPNAT